jgi:anti-anti-sigma factor
MTQQDELAGAHPPTTDVRWPRQGVALVVVGGEQDLASADELSGVLTDTLDQCSHLIVDLSSSEFIDSSTIRVLVATEGRADASRRRFNLLLGTAPIVERALEITGVLTALNRVHSLEEALGM